MIVCARDVTSFQPVVPEPNGFAHWFDRSSTSTTEDAFWSSAYSFENLAPGDSCISNPVQTTQQNAREYVPRSSLQSEASQSNYGSLFEFDPGPEGGRGVTFGWNFDDGPPLNLEAESFVDFNFDSDYDFDHSSQSSSSLSNRSWATRHNPTSVGPLTSLETSSMSGTLSTPLSSPFSSNHFPPDAFPLDLQKKFTAHTHLLSADDHQPARLALSPARALRFSICSRSFASKARLVSHANVHLEFACDVQGCGKDCTTAKDLGRHRGTVHADNVTTASLLLSYQESGCQYSTRRKDHLKRHMTRHGKKLKDDS